MWYVYVLKILGTVAAVIVFVAAAFIFGVPQAPLPDRKPNRETLTILLILLGLICLIIVPAVLLTPPLPPRPAVPLP